MSGRDRESGQPVRISKSCKLSAATSCEQSMAALSLSECVCVRACACHKIASRAAWPPQKLQLDWNLLLSNNQDLLAANYFWPSQTETKMKAGRIFNLHAK